MTIGVYTYEVAVSISHSSFESPVWKQLIVDIEAGKIAAVLAKDMSCIGRNYLQTGFYTDVLFRKKHVRFIAVNNGIDNSNPSSGEFAPFLNVMNEWYLRDQSRKVTAAYQLKGKQRLPTNNNCVYGYRKDPEDKNHWLVDEEAAAVVRHIFQLALEGWTLIRLPSSYQQKKCFALLLIMSFMKTA